MATSPALLRLRAASHLRDDVHASGGVCRASALQRLGHSRYTLGQAVERGELLRVRRDWVSLPGADAELVAAARAGVVLSCVTQARRLGLWVTSEPRTHVAAHPHSRGGKPDRVVVHWSVPLVPRPPDVLEDPLENVLVIVAGCLPHEDAVAVWESALRQGLTRREVLMRLPLPASAIRVLEDATGFADSGLETIFRVRLRWLNVRIVPQAWIAGHRVDFLIGDRLIVQIDGGTHIGSQRAADNAHDAELMLRGFHVIRVSYAQVMSDWPSTQVLIMHAVAQGLHLAR